MIQVMIVDDHKMILEGLKKLIEFDAEIKVIEQAKDGNDCLSKLEFSTPDVILLDINMPERDGIETLKIIKERKKYPKVLVLTVHNEVEYLIKAIDIGVDGYILKDSGSKELVRAIRYIYQGEKFIQPSMIPLLNSKLIARDIDQQKIDLLSERELEVLKLTASGHFNKSIANELNISERTVKNHLSNIFRKIDCEDRTQATIFSIRNGLVNVYD